VSLSDRDRKLLLAIVPVVVLFGYWFLLLAPKRQEAGKLGTELSKQEQKRTQAESEVQRLTTARKSFASDYATVVRLGKAIPNSVDMPSLIVQLQKAASGTGIAFDRIHAGPRTTGGQAAGSSSSSTASPPGGGSTASSSGSAPASGGSAPAAAAGGEKAGTGVGRATEQANETKQSQDQQAQGGSSGTSSSSPSGSSPSGGSSSSSGASSTGGGSTTGGASGAQGGASGAQGGASGQPAAGGAPGLDTVPLEFTFRGSFFDLTDFFHRLKRFVHVANDRIAVKGRLMTVDGFDLKTKAFPRLEATVTATVYLAPKQQGATAGATPDGPAASAGQASASGSSPAPSTQPPAAVATR
jgi:hypothetical protein